MAPTRRTGEQLPADLRPGTRCVMSFGILTLRAATPADGDRVTLHWEEPQPAVTVCRFNTVTVTN